MYVFSLVKEEHRAKEAQKGNLDSQEFQAKKAQQVSQAHKDHEVNMDSQEIQVQLAGVFRNLKFGTSVRLSYEVRSDQATICNLVALTDQVERALHGLKPKKPFPKTEFIRVKYGIEMSLFVQTNWQN